MSTSRPRLAGLTPSKTSATPRVIPPNTTVPAYGVETPEGDRSLIHRVTPAEGTAVGTVRVYLTVFAFAEQGTTYKDIHASAGGIKLINKTADTMFNIGDPRRAFHYFNTYRAQTPAAVCPIIRSFDIPRALYDEVTGQAISEAQRAKLGRNNPYNVDKERGQNQFGVHQAVRDKIEQQGRNLISYAEAGQVTELRKRRENGTVKDVNELRRQLGMPVEGLAFMAPLKGAHVVSPREDAEHGAVLTRLYDDLDALVTARTTKPQTLVPALKTIEDRCVAARPGYYGDLIATGVRKRNLRAERLQDIIKFRDEIGRAATFSVIPQMVTEEYLQANARLHADGQLKAILTRVAADLDRLLEVRSAGMGPITAQSRLILEQAIFSKCFPAAPGTYGKYVGDFLRRKWIASLTVPALTTLRDAVRNAAAASTAPQSVDETYLRSVNAYALTIRDKNNQPLSPWAASQQYQIRTPAPTADRAAKAPKARVTPEEAARVRAERGRKNSPAADLSGAIIFGSDDF
jgi:hypothetical protein